MDTMPLVAVGRDGAEVVACVKQAASGELMIGRGPHLSDALRELAALIETIEGKHILTEAP